MICTGSQGEPRSALTRIARGDHPAVTLAPGDAVIFSSRIIPGNEKPIGQLQNDLARLGVDIVTEKDHFVHVSGHPARDELIAMYQWVRPRIAIPVHGEARHLAAHAKLAEECQVGQGLAISNGTLVQLRPGGAEILEHVHVGRIGLDGKALLSLDSEVMRVRHRTIWNGSAVVSLAINKRGELLGQPQITVHGLLNQSEHRDELAELSEAVRTAVQGVPLAARGDDQSIKEAARIALAPGRPCQPRQEASHRRPSGPGMSSRPKISPSPPCAAANMTTARATMPSMAASTMTASSSSTWRGIAARASSISGCGTGRLAIPLCRAGKRVTGLDAMPSMIEPCPAQGEDLPIRWVDGDFRDFDLGDTYDLTISCAHAFQGLLTEDDQQRYLACTARHLVPGGVLGFRHAQSVAPPSRSPSRANAIGRASSIRRATLSIHRARSTMTRHRPHALR